MSEEKPTPLPLTGEEVRKAVLHKIEESLSKSCHLRYDDAYSSFKAEITVRLTLSDYGREVNDNHVTNLCQESGAEGSQPRTVESNVTMEPLPPNEVRIQTEQSVPVKVIEKGKQVTKYVRYAARKTKSTQETTNVAG